GDDPPHGRESQRRRAPGLSIQGEHVRDRPRTDRRQPGGRRGTLALRSPRPHACGLVLVEEARGQVPPCVLHSLRGRLPTLRGLITDRHGITCRLMHYCLIEFGAYSDTLGFSDRICRSERLML